MITTEYITQAGDRWDLIAYKAYGTVDTITLDDDSTSNAMSLIIATNPDIVITDILDAGLVVKVPVVSNSTNLLTNSSLPPWKQA